MSGPAFGRFFLPGPTEVRPEILRAQVGPMIGHRGPEMRALMERLQRGLRELFRTERPVHVSTSSATGLMEAAVRNGVRTGEDGPGAGGSDRGRLLSLVNGAFSERFADIARACGRDVDVLEVPWGRAHDPADVRVRLAEGRFDAVTVVHSETSTGVLQPLEALARVVAEHADALFLVDSVSGLGGAPVETDAWDLGYVLAGSQKALALPPGLAVGAASPAFLERAAEVPGRGRYFDLVEFERNARGNQTPNTPALSLLYALEAQLGRIAAEGLEARWARHAAMAERVEGWVREMRDGHGVDLSILAPPGERSPTVTCIRLPEALTGPDVADALDARGWVIGTGYGRLKQSTIRIGHMGDHTVEELDALLAVLGEVLREARPAHRAQGRA